MIIGIVGFINSGKGTVGDILVNEYDFKKFAFADPLKDATAAIFGWDRALLEGDTKESREFREKRDEFWSARLGWDVTPRKALQRMGTEAGREVFGDDVWIAALEKRIHNLDKVVVTDVRFQNEIEAIRSVGGKVIRVKRGVEPVWYPVAHQQNTNPPNRAMFREDMMDYAYPEIHQSEWDWIGSNFDAIILNEGTIEDLRGNVKEMLRAYTESDSPSS